MGTRGKISEIALKSAVKNPCVFLTALLFVGAV
ncbi:hypothetical protein CF65_00697 [Aggregatibacter actinomycetemcomitans HK1651]|nr:hypothetical protein CF65_00697 [Aggregatibacter actinomycetemcomitans HK1651]